MLPRLDRLKLILPRNQKVLAPGNLDSAAFGNEYVEHTMRELNTIPQLQDSFSREFFTREHARLAMAEERVAAVDRDIVSRCA